MRSLDEEGIAASRNVLDLTRINPFNDVSDRVSRPLMLLLPYKGSTEK